MRGVLEAVDARARARAGTLRGTGSHTRLLVAAALLSLALGLAVRESLAGRSSTGSPPVRAQALPAQSLLALPPALRGPVSAALGADNPSYLVTPAAAGGLSARTPAQHLTSSFGPGRVTVRSRGASLSLDLRAIGSGSALSAVAPVAPREHANRVTFSHPGVSEWYANGPLGLEQGFTLSRSPAGRQNGPITLELNLSSSAPAVLGAGAKSFTVGRPGSPQIAYSGLVATDARGRVLPSHLQIIGGHLLIQLDGHGAAYPLNVDPFVQQAALSGSGASGNARFGASVALSGDGNTALVGGWKDASEVGAAWVFARSGESWTQQGSKLTGSGETGAGRFGTSVALSENGNTALIGGYADNASVGAAWVFTRSGSTWTQQGTKLTGAGETGAARFGDAVALSDSGSTALIGGSRDHTGAGAAWVFTREGATWSQQGSKLTGSGEATEGSFGTSVALAGNGNTALIGAPNDGKPGAAYAFAQSGGVWSQQGSKLTGTGGEGEFLEFGYSVALSEEGNAAIIGGPGDGRVGHTETGAAWAFARSGESWSQQGSKLTAVGETGAARFGEFVALSGEGTTALISATDDNTETGAVWVFVHSGGSWAQTSELTGAEGADEELGSGVAISDNATTALAGARFAHAGAGAAYVYTTGAHAPTAVTGRATLIRPTSAVLNATVNPNDQEVTVCQFEYGTSVAYEHTIACSASPGSGEAPVAVSAQVLGLTTGQEYHFRISATNATGVGTGADSTFTPSQGALPTITKLSVKKGPPDGDTGVTITGTNFEEPVTVDFGTTPALATHVVSSTSITVVTPPGTAGPASVTVTTEEGTSEPNAHAVFKYGNPTLTGVSPSKGPLTGGTGVTVKGSGFALGSGTTLLFKHTPGTSVNCSSTTECTAISPAGGKAGTVAVAAEIGKAKSKKAPAAIFTYE